MSPGAQASCAFIHGLCRACGFTIAAAALLQRAVLLIRTMVVLNLFFMLLEELTLQTFNVPDCSVYVHVRWIEDSFAGSYSHRIVFTGHRGSCRDQGARRVVEDA